jgi:hypothetical protein
MRIRVEKSCPVPQTHNRLRQMHDLWHEMQSAYPFADEFATKLNACIQAGRSVTFVLQKELSKEAWFDEWYALWRERMKTDNRMRWLVEARNQIEKQGDLTTASIAIVSLLATDHDEALERIEVPPLASPADVATAVRLSELPARLRSQTVLAVERRWTVPQLADDELLDTLAYCYGFLAEIVAEAHERRGMSMQMFSDEDHIDDRQRRPHPSGRLPCMVSTVEARRAYWHLGEETIMRPGVASLSPPSLEDVETAAARYGLGSGHQPSPTLPLNEQAAILHSVARRMLERDDCHYGVAFLISGEGAMHVVAINFDDQQDKIVKVRQLAQTVDETGAEAVIFTGESWIAPEVARDDPRARLRAGEREDRKEMLATYVMQRGAPTSGWVSLFEKGAAGSVTFNTEPHEMEMDDPALFQPVLSVWKRWDSEAEVRG